MILRTPPLKKRRAELLQPEDANNTSQSPSSNRRLLVFEDLQAPEHSHGHAIPISSDEMLCTYQCRQMVKSEFFDALSSAEKQAHDYQTKCEALNENFSKAESERKIIQEKFLDAEQELAAAKGHQQMLQDQLKKEVEFYQERLKKQIQSFSVLEMKFQKEMDLRKNSELSAAKSEEKASLLEEKLSTLSESVDREKGRLQRELVQMRSESKLSVYKISADLEKMECRAKNAEKESALLKEQFEELKKQLDESIQEKFELQKKFSNIPPNSSSVDTSLMVKHLQEELRNYESEVREARKLKASHKDIELLKEKLYEEKSSRERAELDLLKLTDIQSNMQKLEEELSIWKSVIKELPGVVSADDILKKVSDLQKEVAYSMMKAGETQADMKKVQEAHDKAVLDKQNAETEVAMLKEKTELYQAEIKRLELMLGSITEERKRLQNTVNELKEHRNHEGETGLGSGAIVQELETSLDMKETYVKELENSLSEMKEINSLQRNEMNLLNERLTNEARRVKMLEREGDRLRSDISLLESKLGHGDFSSANTKVLRMVNTLAVENEAKRMIEALQNELQKTKEKLLAVEELKKQSSDAGTHVDSYIAGKIKQLKEQIATLEKREERYKTVFAERISVFRRACCELFGYKIVMDDHQRSDGIPVTRFTLHSIYAMSEDEKLQFEYESGNTNIVVTDYTSQPEISRQVDIFIRKMNSIPAFTANLTVESFNKRTLS